LEGSQQVTGIRIAAGGTADDPALIDELYVGPTRPAGLELPATFPELQPGHLFRFALLGDPQIGFGAPQPPHTLDVVRFKAAIEQAEAARCELALCIGDMVHQTTESATQGFLEGLQSFRKARWYPVPGNHDPDEWYQKHVRKELDYSFEYQGLTFIGMKTWTPDHQGAVTPQQLAWLEDRLRAARDKGHEIILWCHVTPYGPNPRGEWVRAGQAEMLALLRQYQVLAVLAGHFHRELWHFEQHGVHHVVAPGITRTRGQLGWVIYDVYPDRLVQHFKPLWNAYEAHGMPVDHVVQGPLVWRRRAPAAGLNQ
jgi:Icc-related predicted phosphoesterase